MRNSLRLLCRKTLPLLMLGFIIFAATPVNAMPLMQSGTTAVKQLAAPCPGGDFLLFPKWYKYLPGKVDKSGLCSPELGSINDIWLIVAAVIEILLRVAALAAVAFVIVGGVRYVVSQGEPDKTNQARSTIINALIGLLLAVMAATFISFIARSIT